MVRKFILKFTNPFFFLLFFSLQKFMFVRKTWTENRKKKERK
jgi:hypothetical protein